ncbi:MAG: methyltransferase domain-containing protein [Ktedonobacterales bacterium]|nr:methyltransferase domain-containing protein [Ktedonobacterales bacterium]
MSKLVTRPAVALEGGRKVLRVGGVIQSVQVDERYVPDIWDAMLPRRRPANVLILGLGGGTIATLLTRRWGPLPIVGVERDPAVVWLARHEFGLGTLAHVEMVAEDAFRYLRRCEHRFDYICVDLYTAGKLAHGVFGAPFLRDVARLLSSEGTAAFNLWRSPYVGDQVRRLRRALAVREIVEADDNLVVHCARL